MQSADQMEIDELETDGYNKIEFIFENFYKERR